MSGRDRRGQGRGGGGGLLGKLAGGVGLAAEAIQHQRNKSKSPKPETASGPAISGSGSAAHTNDDHEPSAESNESEDEVFEREDGVTKHDEAIWDLDDASTEVDTDISARKAVIPKSVAKEPARISVLVDAFVSAHPPAPFNDLDELPCPVIIPQRRPETRGRGFVRAYSPYLESCGVSEQVFMEFLDFYDESLEYSNVIKVVQVAGGIIGLVPEAVCQAVSFGIKAGTKVAGAAHSNQRSNDFIARMNQQFFMPMGLVCLIMKFKPDERTGKFNLDSSVNNATTKLHTNLDSSHGQSNEFEFPQTAPLVFPTLDKSEDKEKLSKFQRTKKFVADYQDRRAQAQFELENPGTTLATSMQGQTTFESGLADPRKAGNMLDVRGTVSSTISEYTGLGGGANRRNAGGYRTGQAPQGHAASEPNQSGRRGLLGGGGLISGRAARREGRQDRRAARWGYSRDDLQYDQAQDGAGAPRRRGRRDRRGGLRGQRGTGPIGLISKVLKQDVLYMMIVPMPSDEEIAQAVPSSDIQFVDVST